MSKKLLDDIEINYSHGDLEMDGAESYKNYQKNSGMDGKDFEDVGSALRCSKNGSRDNPFLKLVADMKDEIVARDVFCLMEDAGRCLFDMS